MSINPNFLWFQGAQTLADIFQRRFGKYGDDSGIRDHLLKKSEQDADSLIIYRDQDHEQQADSPIKDDKIHDDPWKHPQ